MPSPSVSMGNGWVSAQPFGVLKFQISVVDVVSIATNFAPLPAASSFGSVGIVRIISGAESESSCTMTGPGNFHISVSLGLKSVPGTGKLSQSKEPLDPSIFHIHILPEFSSIVVTIMAVVSSSNIAQAGSDA